MSADPGDLAKPIPTRSLTLRYFVHFPPDPTVLSLANSSSFEEATGKFSFRSFGEINLKTTAREESVSLKSITPCIYDISRGTRHARKIKWTNDRAENDPRNVVS